MELTSSQRRRRRRPNEAAFVNVMDETCQIRPFVKYDRIVNRGISVIVNVVVSH